MICPTLNLSFEILLLVVQGSTAGKTDKPLQSKLNYIEKNVANGIRESRTQ